MADHLSSTGSWEVIIHVTDLQSDQRLRVHGDMHVGGVILKLVETLGLSRDWSGHALFWTEKKLWLTATRRTLDQYKVHAEATISFTPTHKMAAVQLPDLQVVKCRVDFARNVFKSVASVCKDLGIRYPEELSFIRRKENAAKIVAKNPVDASLSQSPATSSKEALKHLDRLTTEASRTALHVRWLDSSKSLMEQSVTENDVILLRYKFFLFRDLDPSQDAVRINQLYEQAKWSLLTEECSCSEDEGVVFAALQLRIQDGGSQEGGNQEGALDDATGKQSEDDILGDLDDLASALESGSDAADVKTASQVELEEALLYMRPKKFGFNSFKSAYFVYKNKNLSVFETREGLTSTPLINVNVLSAQVTPDLSISKDQFNIHLLYPEAGTEDLSQEMFIKCSTKKQYAKWMAALSISCRNMDSTYESEVETIETFLSLQEPSTSATPALDFNPEDVLPPTQVKKHRNKTLVKRISEASALVAQIPDKNAKMRYIQFWQTLTGCGVAHFEVRCTTSPGRKDEVLAISSNRLLRMDAASCAAISVIRFATMQSWSVNWEIKEFHIERRDGKVRFLCLSANPKIVHEFIGGYIFLSMRGKDKNDDSLNEELFHKLTGGWE